MPLTEKPLSGLKVIELGTLIAGPFASRICGEFGAEVIKIESPDGGDPLRKWRKLYEGTSLWWFVQARNKKSLTLNLKHPDGLAILKKLLSEADILIDGDFGRPYCGLCEVEIEGEACNCPHEHFSASVAVKISFVARKSRTPGRSATCAKNVSSVGDK